ncbi:hypothetical protein B6V01_003560 [Methanosarcinales archaeon ex4572_44]|nr:MAG: hypothetical protein B6U67_05535 [Methanosarcinales archaeon ex4484_138]PHP45536.1 MAG: hypothetical protein B6V01_003560 [Methanosarcinales archaeon ex4572_44]RLG25237.1 MAG: hypothetical protein DRN85_06245 [Methanosarcinales archaeon]RLG27785.1 MAG: hypothetical protein DRN70_01610 [Methanosarcinales archaeon]
MASKRAAIVFDSAGTLLFMHRIAKDINKKTILSEFTTTAVAGKKSQCVITIIHFEPVEELKKCPPATPIHNFLTQHNVDVDIACASLPLSKDTVIEAIRKDTRATVRDLQEVLDEVLSRCDDHYYIGIGMMVDTETMTIPYVLSSCGKLFPSAKSVVKTLGKMGVNVFIASGDRQLDIEKLADCIGIPRKRAFGLSTPTRKKEIIEHLKEDYNPVIMVGDGLNDILAFQTADIAVLTREQESDRPKRLIDAADFTIDRLEEIIPILKDIFKYKEVEGSDK